MALIVDEAQHALTTVDDAAMHRWFEQRVSEGRWPPVDPQGQFAVDDDAAESDAGDTRSGSAP